MMKTSWIVLIAAVAVPLFPGGPAWGDTAARAARAAMERRFDEMDANRDGRIDRSEYVEYECKKANERFDAADGNKDGFITRKEAEEAMKRRQEAIRAKMRAWRRKEGQRRGPQPKGP